MREILFKAKQIDNGEWIEGSLIDLDIDSGYCYIVQPYKKASILPIIFLITDRMKLVDPETLCQFTGLCDKNGNKIWENDILRLDDGTVLKVSWHHFKASWVISKKGWLYNHFFGEAVEPEDIEAIGNIFDNPELLQEESDE